MLRFCLQGNKETGSSEVEDKALFSSLLLGAEKRGCFCCKEYVLCLFLLLTMVLSSSAFAAKMFYRYTNDQGVLVLDDTIPSKYVKNGYTIVDQRGKVIKIINPTRTEAEQRADNRLQIRRQQQERLRIEQEANDRVLLKTFTNPADIIRARDNKRSALDNTIEIIEGTLTRLQDQLDNLLSKAAALERTGKAVSKDLKLDISDLRAQIQNNKSYIEEKQQEKLAIGIKADVDLKRYNELMGDHSAEVLSQQKAYSHELSQKFICPDLVSCNKAWSLSQIFVQKNATMPIQLVTNSLIATAQPKHESDITLAVSREPLQDGAAEIKLETHCHLSKIGEEFCKSTTVVNIHERFYEMLHGNYSPCSKEGC